MGGGVADLRAPFPWFGGKRRAAGIIWDALGDPARYTEPFAGSLAVLLARPPVRGRRYETVNDADGWLVNFWRSVQHAPDEVARHAAGPLTEIDYHARLAWLQERRSDDLVSWLEGDPEAHDAKAAGWWVYVVSSAIGNPFARGGPWQVRDGRLRKGGASGVPRELPEISCASGVWAVADPLATMRALSQRLRSVQITCGDWSRVLTRSPLRLDGAAGDRCAGVLLDPPYSTGDTRLYSEQSQTISAEVRGWCLTADPTHRIVLCGYEDEHDALLAHGWRKVAGKSGSSGYNRDPLAGRRERLWMSPACLDHTQAHLWEAYA